MDFLKEITIIFITSTIVSVQFSFSSVAKSYLTLCDPMDLACQALLSSIISWSLLRFMSIQLVMLFSHLILCRPLILPSIFTSIRVFSNKAALPNRWPKY